MEERIHKQFVATAKEVGPNLHQAILKCGPISRRRSNRQPLPEVLCRTIAGQQLSVKAARTIWGRVLSSCDGTPLMEHIASAQTADLRACGLSNSKCKALHAIATANDAGRLNPQKLRSLPSEQRSEVLKSIWGVGQWTADMLNIFYFGEEDIWPDSDVAARKTLERLIDRRRKTQTTAQRFAPWRSRLAIYMWQIADAKPDQAADANTAN